MIRTIPLRKSLVDEINFATDNLIYFNIILRNYPHKFLATNYDSENPRKFKSTCLMQLGAQSCASNVVLLLDIVIFLFCMVCLQVNVTSLFIVSYVLVFVAIFK